MTSSLSQRSSSRQRVQASDATREFFAQFQDRGPPTPPTVCFGCRRRDVLSTTDPIDDFGNTRKLTPSTPQVQGKPTAKVRQALFLSQAEPKVFKVNEKVFVSPQQRLPAIRSEKLLARMHVFVQLVKTLHGVRPVVEQDNRTQIAPRNLEKDIPRREQTAARGDGKFDPAPGFSMAEDKFDKRG